jgi:hypothetical protein
MAAIAVFAPTNNTVQKLTVTKQQIKSSFKNISTTSFFFLRTEFNTP